MNLQFSLGHVENPYTKETVAIINRMVDDLREEFKLEMARNDELHFSRRYYCNDTFMIAIQRAATEREFLSNPKYVCWKTLDYLAYTDYYYTFEKDWG